MVRIPAVCKRARAKSMVVIHSLAQKCGLPIRRSLIFLSFGQKTMRARFAALYWRKVGKVYPHRRFTAKWACALQSRARLSWTMCLSLKKTPSLISVASKVRLPASTRHAMASVGARSAQRPIVGTPHVNMSWIGNNSVARWPLIN